MSFLDYISDNVTGDYKESSDGDQMRINCPFCSAYENDYKLYIGKKSPELWLCFRCKYKGNPNQFIQMYEGVDYEDAKNTLELYGVEDTPMSKLAEEYGEGLDPQEYIYMMTLGLHRGDTREEEEVNKKPPKFIHGYRPLTNDTSPPTIPFREYLYSRGIDEDQINKHQIGYVIDGHMTTLKGSAIPVKNHVVFITYNTRGEYIYWNTRSIDPRNYIKTFNAPSNTDEYGKSDVIFNLNHAMTKNNVILCEGVFDALTFSDNGISTFGKRVSEVQVNLLKKYLRPEQKLFIFLDADAVDEANDLSERLNRPNTYIVVNPTTKDASDLGRKEALNIVVNHSVPASGQGRLIAKINTL